MVDLRVAKTITRYTMVLDVGICECLLWGIVRSGYDVNWKCDR